MMAQHDNLRTIPLAEYASDSEEDGEIESSSQIESTVQDDMQDSDSSKEDGDDSLDIKPPQASVRGSDSRSHHDDRKKSRHSRKHESRRRDHHRRYDRNSHREGKSSWSGESGRKSRDAHHRSNRYRDESTRDKEREFRKGVETREVTDVRDIRLKRNIREGRDRLSDSKIKDDRQLLEECREKRLRFIERQREQNGGQLDRSHSRKEDNQSTRDAREIIREREKNLHDKERRLERFRSPKKNSDAPSDTEGKKEKELHITPVPFSEEAMDYEDSKEEEDEDVEEEEESDHMSENDDTDTDSESSNSGTEGGDRKESNVAEKKVILDLRKRSKSLTVIAGTDNRTHLSMRKYITNYKSMELLTSKPRSALSSRKSRLLPSWFADFKWFSYYIAYTNSFMNPIIYGRFNKTFSEGFCILLRCGYRRDTYARSRRTFTTGDTSSPSRNASQTLNGANNRSSFQKSNNLEMKLVYPATDGDQSPTMKETCVSIADPKGAEAFT